MKKILFSIAILGILLCMSCETEADAGDVNPFIGTWEDSNSEIVERYVFTKNHEVVRTIHSASPLNEEQINETYNGTYDYDKTTLSMIFSSLTSSGRVSALADYTIINNNMTLTFSHSRIYTYKKIK